MKAKIECKITRKTIKVTTIVAPPGWHKVTVGESMPGDYWNGGNSKYWKECPAGIGAGNCATVIRKNRQ